MGNRSKIEKPASEIDKPAQSKKSAAEYRERLTSMVSMMLGMVAALMTALVPIFDKLKQRNGVTLSDKNLELFLPVFAVFSSIGVTLIAIAVYRDIARRRHEVDLDKIASATRTLEMKLRTMKRPKLPDPDSDH